MDWLLQHPAVKNLTGPQKAETTTTRDDDSHPDTKAITVTMVLGFAVVVCYFLSKYLPRKMTF